jgi:hypothetical protein
MVLGVQCLESLGPVLWDFGRCTAVLIRNGHHVLWSAESSPASMPTIAMATPDMMEDLLLRYDVLFHLPTSLPLARQCCHHIHLTLGMVAVVV